MAGRLAPTPRRQGERGPGRRPNAVLRVNPRRRRNAPVTPPIPETELPQRPRVRLNKTMVREAIIAARGNLSAAGRSLGCTRVGVENWVKKHEDLAQEVRDQRAQFVDKAEDSIMRQVEKDVTQATIFVLKSLGKDRGWIDSPNVQLHAHAEVGSGSWRDIMSRAIASGQLEVVEAEVVAAKEIGDGAEPTEQA